MRIVVEDVTALRFGDGSPVRAASAIAPFGDGWLVVQDDATHAAWCRDDGVTAVRVVEPVDGLDEFSSAAGTKHLKPDFEAACAVPGGGVLLLGSGSTAARMRASLVTAGGFTVADLTPVYLEVADALGIDESLLNLEGACLAGDVLRWFQRGNAAAGVPSACVQIGLPALLAAVSGEHAAAREQAGRASTNPAPTDPASGDPASGDRVGAGRVRRYDLGTVDGVALAVTDAVALSDGRVLVSAAAEDTPNAVDDGPVIASALALLDPALLDPAPRDDDGVLAIAEIPASAQGPWKVEGLAVIEETAGGLRLVAVVDADDPLAASSRLTLRVEW